MTDYHDGSGFAFPLSTLHDGLSRREWYATHSPGPSAATIEDELLRDRQLPLERRRTVLEIMCDLRFAYADAMLAASKRAPR